MTRISLAVLASAAAVVFPTNAVASKHHDKHGKHHGNHHAKKPAKSGGIETGTYKATTTVAGLATAEAPVEDFNITLESAKCATAPGLGSPAQHLCVALQSGLYIVLATPTRIELSLSSFATPVALPSSDTLTEHAPTTADTFPGSPPGTGQNTFSVTFTKHGTASGHIEATMTGLSFGTESISETPVNVPFTAKLG